MILRTTVQLIAVLLIAASALGAQAQHADRGQPRPDSTQDRAALTPAPEVPPVQTQHEIRVRGESVRYTATTGYLPARDEEGNVKANIFFIAYTREDVSDVTQRPITFAYNGGPGSSSVWLHLGALGPRRVLMTDEGNALPPPATLVDNQDTWLEFTDLVFIDPVLTGYSRPAAGENKSQFHGLEEDIQSVGDFIRLYVTRYGRWRSPKFLAGESYGTTRSAGLSGYLQQRHGMYLNGISLISAVLNFQTIAFNVGNELPFILYVPSYAATAWYHGQLAAELQSQSLEAVVAEARDFTMTEYTLALMQGASLDASRRRDVTQRFARLTGLSEEFIERNDLRIPLQRFVKELLRDESRTVGRLDSRFVGMDRDDAGDSYEYDPSYAVIQGSFTAALNAYVRDDLEYENDITYEILSGRVQPWNWNTSSNPSFNQGYVNVAETLRQAMSVNPDLHVLVANGYYDMATPFFATEYTFDHLGGDPSLLERVRMTYFESGHMMYVHKPSLEKLTRDVRAFYDEVLGTVRMTSGQ